MGANGRRLAGLKLVGPEEEVYVSAVDRLINYVTMIRFGCIVSHPIFNPSVNGSQDNYDEDDWYLCEQHRRIHTVH